MAIANPHGQFHESRLSRTGWLIVVSVIVALCGCAHSPPGLVVPSVAPVEDVIIRASSGEPGISAAAYEELFLRLDDGEARAFVFQTPLPDGLAEFLNSPRFTEEMKGRFTSAFTEELSRSDIYRQFYLYSGLRKAMRLFYSYFWKDIDDEVKLFRDGMHFVGLIGGTEQYQHDPRSEEMLLGMIEDEALAPRLRSAALRNLKNIEKDHGEVAKGILRGSERWELKMAALGYLRWSSALDDEAVEIVLAALEHPHLAIRIGGIHVLRAHKVERALPAVARLTRDPSSGVRGNAAGMLGDFTRDEYLDDLLPALEDDSYDTVVTAVRALAGHGEKAVPHILGALGSTNPYTREAAVGALAYMKGLDDIDVTDRVLKTLRETSYEDMPNVYDTALRVLSKHGDERCLPLLRRIGEGGNFNSLTRHYAGVTEKAIRRRLENLGDP